MLDFFYYFYCLVSRSTVLGLLFYLNETGYFFFFLLNVLGVVYILLFDVREMSSVNGTISLPFLFLCTVSSLFCLAFAVPTVTYSQFSVYEVCFLAVCAWELLVCFSPHLWVLQEEVVCTDILQHWQIRLGAPLFLIFFFFFLTSYPILTVISITVEWAGNVL